MYGGEKMSSSHYSNRHHESVQSGGQQESPYHYSSQYSINHPPAADNSHVVVVEKKKKWGPCMAIMLVLFIILILVLLLLLILFFTVGTRINHNEESAQKLLSPSLNHIDMVSREQVFTAIETGSIGKDVCLFDTAYFDKDYTNLYSQQHLTNARHFDIDRVANKSRTKKYELIHPLQMEEYVRSHGVNKDCHIILYDHGESKISVVTATFVWWLFKLYGHADVSVMDGGLQSWKANSFQVTGAAPKKLDDIGDWKGYWEADHLITYQDVLKNMNSKQYEIIDVRKATDYTGQTKSGQAYTAGHIKGAINIPVEDLIDANTSGLKTLPQLRNLLADKGVDTSKSYIVYCNSGKQASALYFVFKQMNVNVVLYGGSWIEWSWLAPEQFKVLGEDPVRG